MALRSTLAEIKRDLESHVGAKIRLRAHKGRKKTVEREGILENIYPNLFTVRLEESGNRESRVSYTYVDLLTEAVELVICPSEGPETRIETQSR